MSFCESGLRTIRTLMDVNGRLFLCLKSTPYVSIPYSSVSHCSDHIISSHLKHLLTMPADVLFCRP